MKKSTRNIIFGIIAVVIIILAVALINFYPILMMKPTETGKIAGTEITAVRNSQGALYLIESAEGYILIDAGTNKDGVEKSLNDLSINPADIKHVLLTHTDYDHVGSLPLFAEAELYLSEDETEMLSGRIKRNMFSYNSLPDSVGRMTMLKDNQELDFNGITIKCIKTPGHTLGSMSYLVNGKYLFTGDAVKVSNNRLGVHPFTMDAKNAEESLEIIKTLKQDSQLILTAHYGYFEADAIE